MPLLTMLKIYMLLRYNKANDTAIVLYNTVAVIFFEEFLKNIDFSGYFIIFYLAQMLLYINTNITFEGGGVYE
ncbi:hypothetical protein SH2C18_13820 [Clostridium sediminicola]